MTTVVGGVRIVGGGVAGSALALLLDAVGVEVRVYDGSRSYSKPCGEAAPVELLSILKRLNLPEPPIRCELRSYMLYFHPCRVEASGELKWVMIAKGEWIDSMRARLGSKFRANMVRPTSVEGWLVVDARGPFAQPKLLPVWACRGVCSQPSDAILVFDLEAGGLAWSFTCSNYSTFGGGYARLPPRAAPARSMELLKSVGVKCRRLECRWSVLAVPPEIRLESRRGVLRVGEAAGLVMSLGGEGIRPAVISAAALASAVTPAAGKAKVSITKYHIGVAKLAAQAAVQAYMLRRVLAAGKAACGLARLVAGEKRLASKWLSGRLGVLDAASACIKSPTSCLRLLTASRT